MIGRLWIFIAIFGAVSAVASEVKTIRPAKGEILKNGQIIGTLVIPADTILQSTTAPDGSLLVNYLGGQVKILWSDTNLREAPKPVVPDFPQLQTKLGDMYTDVFITERNAAEISIRHSNGTSTVAIEQLDEAAQKQLNYDPEKAAIYLDSRREREARRVEAAKKIAEAKPSVQAQPEARPTVIPEPPPPETAAETALTGRIWNALVAVAPARLYALKIDPAMIADRTSSLYGKGGQPAEPIAEVPPGFLVIATRNCDPVGGAVELDSPIGPHRHAYVYRSDFGHIGRANWRKWWDDNRVTFQMVPEPSDAYLQAAALKPETELHDTFAKNSLVVSNRTGAIQNVYKYRNGPQHSDTGLGFARTATGWFFGYLVERPQAEPVQLAWAEVVKNNDKLCRLKMEKSTELAKGGALFKLADFDSLHRDLTPHTDPREVRILPEHYGTLLQFGLSGVLGEMNAGTAETVKILGPNVPAPQGVEKQVVIKEYGLKFLAWSAERTLIEVVSKRDEREVERRSAGKTLVTDPKPWKTVKASEERWIDNDQDGGLRLTDGRQIYEIARGNHFDKIELRTYSVTANALPK